MSLSTVIRLDHASTMHSQGVFEDSGHSWVFASPIEEQTLGMTRPLMISIDEKSTTHDPFLHVLSSTCPTNVLKL